jgi:uroporphyrin-III C-methyltransferase
VPLTHRDHARGVVFITGHAKRQTAPLGKSKPHSPLNSTPNGSTNYAQDTAQDTALDTTPDTAPDTDWALLAATAAQARLTLVIYMGVSSALRIQNELLTGLPASTPVAIIQNASLPNQRHQTTTLSQLQTTIDRHQLQSPSVIVVGDVVAGLASAGAHPALADGDGTDLPANRSPDRPANDPAAHRAAAARQASAR